MAVESLVNRNNYIGAGSTATYPYAFRIFEDSDLQVIVRLISTGAETTLTLTTHYTVTGEGALNGGNVVLVNGSFAWQDGSGYLLSTYEISIRRVLPLTQETPFRALTSFLPESHEDAFDKEVMIAQQQQDEIERSVRFPDSVDPADFDVELPASLVGQANKIIITNQAGDGFTSAEIDDVAATPLIVGTRASPQSITAAGGISFTGSYWNNTWYIVGSGGSVIVTANPQIADATNVDQRLKIVGTDDTNYVDLSDGTGLVTGGQTIRLGNNSVACFFWDGSNWILESTNGLIPA